MDDRVFGFDSREEQEIFIFPVAYMELTQTSVHRVPRFLFPGPRHWGVNLCLHSIIHFHWLGAWLSTQRTSPEGYDQPYFLVCFCARATTYVPPCIDTGVRIVRSALSPPHPRPSDGRLLFWNHRSEVVCRQRCENTTLQLLRICFVRSFSFY